MKRLLRVMLRCRHFHGNNAIPPERIKWLIKIYDRIIKQGLAFHLGQTPLPCKGKQGRQPKRTGKYNVDRLVYYEACDNIVVAIEREKKIKGWARKKKNDLVNAFNPDWKDLYLSIC